MYQKNPHEGGNVHNVVSTLIFLKLCLQILLFNFTLGTLKRETTGRSIAGKDNVLKLPPNEDIQYTADREHTGERMIEMDRPLIAIGFGRISKMHYCSLGET